MSELFSIQLQNRQQQGRDGVWLDLPTTTEQVQAALRQIGISSDNPQGLFISGYFAEEEKRFAIPYNMVLASNVDELNFLASRLETLSTGERAELNAALQAPYQRFFMVFSENSFSLALVLRFILCLYIVKSGNSFDDFSLHPVIPLHLFQLTAAPAVSA